MLNNIFIALRTPPVPSPTPQHAPRLPAFRADTARMLPPQHPLHALPRAATMGSRGTKAGAVEKKRPRRGKFLPRRGNFLPRLLF